MGGEQVGQQEDDEGFAAGVEDPAVVGVTGVDAAHENVGVDEGDPGAEVVADDFVDSHDALGPVPAKTSTIDSMSSVTVRYNDARGLRSFFEGGVHLDSGTNCIEARN